MAVPFITEELLIQFREQGAVSQRCSPVIHASFSAKPIGIGQSRQKYQ
jgi:hypothetical protein